MEAGETTQQSRPAVISELFNLEGVERLVVPSHPTTKTYIPFGIEGTLVIISPYGEILRMSQHVVEKDPRIICLTSPTLQNYQRDLWSVGNKLHEIAQNRETGLGVRLMSASGVRKPSVETRLEWLNGRWPCIHYEADGLAISVIFTVDRGLLSQQYVIANSSEKAIDIQFDLQIGDCEVNTLYINDTQWAGHSEPELSPEEPSILPGTNGAFHVAERELKKIREASIKDDYDAKSVVRGEAVIAVFHGGTLVCSDVTLPISFPHDYGDTDDEPEQDRKRALNPSKPLHVKAKGLERLVVQYKLQAHGSHDYRVREYTDVDTFLKDDRFGNWSFQQNERYNPIFRRHLEHILCVCLVEIVPNSEQQRRFAFISDLTFESGSAPLNDFYIFRYLLFMYRILETDEHVRPISDFTDQDTTNANFDKVMLQDRIKKACKGHLLWCFEKNVLLANQSWPLSKSEDGLDSQPFLGSLQMLKLFEFARVFKNERLIVNCCLRSGAETWVDALTRNRDAKSELWYKDTKKAYVAWEGHRGEGSEWLELPEYRLRDLIYIWKALKCLEEMVSKSDYESSSKLWKSLDESKLRGHYVRKVILQHFLYQEVEAGAFHIADRSASRDIDSPSEKTESTTGSFAIAVRRTRERERLLFYATDAMLHDGIEWGFFENDLEIETLSTKNRLTKVDVHLSWENTIRAQGADLEAVWEKPLRYALAITMAKYGSLDSSMSPEQLKALSWERLLACVTPYGLFADKIEWDTKRPEMVHFSRSKRSPWEIPTLLLRKRFETLELAFFRDPPTQSKIVNNEQKAPQPSDSNISQDARTAMKKSIVLEKKKMRSNKKPDMNLVSDPIDRKVKAWLFPFPDFLSSRPPYGSMEKEVERLEHQLNIDLSSPTDDGLKGDLEIILKRGFERWKGVKEWHYEVEGGGKEAFSFFNYSAILVDIGQHKRNEPDIDRYDADDLDTHLRQARSVEKAKKRFHYLGPLQVEHALINYLATPVKDRRNMAQFYIRHTSFSSHFHEDVHPLADVWAAELHLGFLQLVDTDERIRPQYTLDNDNVCEGRQRNFPHIVKDSQFDIYKASLGYRLVGDMGDRFWSGWLLAYVPGGSRIFGHPYNGTRSDYAGQWFDEKTKNDQRKILEPFLVGNMVDEVYQSTDKILRHVDQWLDPELEFSQDREESKGANIFKANDRNFGIKYNRSTTCLDLEAILSMLRRLSKANIDALFQWGKREESRPYKPRWSEKDELNHREQVDHQERRAAQQIFLLKDQHLHIETSIDQIRAHRKELMDNLNLTNAENVRTFTYATVIFYPLSFVATLFSMQGPPNHSTTSRFLQASAIALVITLVIVFNAEVLAWPIRRLRHSISLSARERMGETSNMFPVSWKKTLNNIKEAEEQDVLHDNEMPTWPRSKLIYLLFLVIYLIVKFPASRIVLAYQSVVRNNARTPESISLTAFRVLIAITMLPIFVAVWTVLVLWSILHWIWRKIWSLRTFQEQMDKKLLEEVITEYVEKEEKSKEQDGERENDRKGASGTAYDEKGHQKGKGLKERGIERKNRLKEKVAEARSVARKGEEGRLQKQVALLINPPELYKAKSESFKSRTKKGKEPKTTIPRISTATTSSREDEATMKIPDQGVLPEDRILNSRSIWRLVNRLKKKVIDDEVEVQGRDEQVHTAKDTQLLD